MNIINNDPVGAAITAKMQGVSGARIRVESNLAEDDVIEVDYLFRTYDEMPELEHLALDACRGSVLDVGAGAGCHSLVLQERGFAVAALDKSEGATHALAARGVKNILQDDIYKLEHLKFDTLLLLMNGIGIAGTLQGLTRLLNHARTLLQPGGQILLESTDILYMYEDEDGGVVLDLNAGYYGEVKYNMHFGNVESGWFDWLFIDPPILQDYAEAAGYQFELLYEGEFGNYLARLSL